MWGVGSRHKAWRICVQKPQVEQQKVARCHISHRPTLKISVGHSPKKMIPARLELTTFSVLDWRATNCATEPTMTHHELTYITSS